MSIFSKIGKVLKKIAVPALGMAAGAFGGPALGSIANAIGGAFSAKDAAPAASPTYTPTEDGYTDNPSPSDPVTISAKKLPPETGGINWDNVIKIGAPLASGAMSYIGQQQTNAANAQQAQKQMDFQEQQTSTSYQRGVADMKAAGLNPMLAYSQGGAQSGSGSQAQMGNELGAGANSALSTAMQLQQMQSIGAQVQNTQANTNKTNAETANTLLMPKILENQGKAGEWDYQLKREALNQAQLANYFTNQTMNANIANAKDTAAYQEYKAKEQKYGLDKAEAYSNYYKDPNKLWGGAYEPSRLAVQEAGTTASRIARDLAGAGRDTAAIIKPFGG